MAFEKQGQVDVDELALQAQQAKNAGKTAAMGQVVIDRLDEKNKNFAKDLGGFRVADYQKGEEIKTLQRQVDQLELEKSRMIIKMEK